MPSSNSPNRNNRRLSRILGLTSLTALPFIAVNGCASNNVSNGMVSGGSASGNQTCYIQSCFCVPNEPRPEAYLKDELILTFPKGLNRQHVSKLMNSYGLTEKRQSYLGSLGKVMMIADTGKADAFNVVQDISTTSTTIDSATNNLYQPRDTSNNYEAFAAPFERASSYALALTGVNQAQKLSRGKGVLIGMIDTPVDTLHKDIKRSVAQDYVANAVPRSNAYLKHGTSVAGIMVSSVNGIGIAPESDLYAVSAFSASPQTKGKLLSSSSRVARAIERMITRKVDLLNMSFAGGKDRIVSTMVKRAHKSGIVIVAASGNDGKEKKTYPAALDEVIAVTAVDNRKRPYKYANRGDYIDVAAPGVGIVAPAPGNKYRIVTGTSIAAAHVTGALAILMARKRSVNDLLLLTNTAADLGARGPDTVFGYGLVNVFKAMRSLGR